MNSCVFMGRISNNPSIKYVGEGKNQKAVCNFRIGVAKKVKKKKGELTPTNWISCAAFGKTGENIEKYFRKGNRILVRGEINLSDYRTESGSYFQKTQLWVQEFNFVDSKDFDGSGVTIGDDKIFLPSPGEEDFNLPENPFSM